MTRASKIWLGLAALNTAVGLAYGLTQDIWGWWWISVGLVAIGLWLVWRDEASPYRPWAKRLLIAIAAVLALMVVGALAFVVWFSSYEF